MTSHERHVVSNHRSFDYLFNSFGEPTSKKRQISTTGPLWGEFTGHWWIRDVVMTSCISPFAAGVGALKEHQVTSIYLVTSKYNHVTHVSCKTESVGLLILLL